MFRYIRMKKFALMNNRSTIKHRMIRIKELHIDEMKEIRYLSESNDATVKK